MTYYAVIEHDNGVPGQRGYTEWDAASREEAEQIAAAEVASMEAADIFVYDVHIGAY